MKLVVVESPAKAKTINKYLGKNYLVLASYGHIRDLPSRNGSVDPDNKFEMVWEVDSLSKKYLKEITNAAKNSHKIILATDPDREGEAIAWHIKEYLIEKSINFVVQINGKKRDVVNIPKDTDEEEMIKKIRNDQKLSKYLDGKEIKKTIFISNKLINLILN